MNNSNSQKNTLLQAATSQPTKQSLQQSIFSPTQEKLKNKKFPSLQKNKTLQPHSPRQTDTNFNGGQLATQYLQAFHKVMDERSTGGNIKFASIFFCGSDEQVESMCNKLTFVRCDSDGHLIPAKKYCANSWPLPASVKRQKRTDNLQIKIMESQRTKQHIRKPHKPTLDQSLQKSCFHVHAHRVYLHYD